MISESNDMCPFVTIRVFAVLVDRLNPSGQTYRASFVSMNESHLEALAVVRGILLNVRNYQRRAKVESFPARSFTCCRPSSIAFYSLDQRMVGSIRVGVKNRRKRPPRDLLTLN